MSFVSITPFQLSGKYADSNSVSSGIGVETARVLASTGATVYGTAHNLEKAWKALGHELLDTAIWTNRLSHFRLFYLLKDVLLASSTPQFHSRVISMSSAGHYYSPLWLDNINFDGDKTASICLTNHIERLYGAQGLHGYSVTGGKPWELSKKMVNVE
ncbi:hypothetical protein HD806DRAFT_517914 [Xylariaceae sp. AK1471]|nr:hypothetical protein HD806DRAFT_517914 [Xylariaceae sp. AK1471]